MSEKKEKKELGTKAKIALLILCPVLVIALASVAVVITARTIVDGEQYSFEDNRVVEVDVPADSAAVVAFITAADEAAESAPDVRAEQSVSVSVSDLAGSFTGEQKSILEFLSGDICSAITGMYETKTADYGQDASFAMLPPIESDEASAELSEDGRRINVNAVLDPKTSEAAAYYAAKDEAVKEKILAASTDECEITGITAEMTELTVNAQTDTADGRLVFVNAVRKYAVEAKLIFSGGLAGLGEQDITFNFSVNERFGFSYAGIFISQDQLSLDKNGFQTLGVSANVAENAGEGDFTVTFTSSDENVAKVDANGMVEAVAPSDESITVTATLEYLGMTYTDSCTVFVGTPAEGVSVSPAKMTVKTGDKFSFEAKVKPSDATITDVIWISEDENICAVNEETGEVTAVAPGETRIIAVTVDGHYMSASEVTVEGGNANG